MKILAMVAFILTVIGGINWGLVGLLDMNLVTAVLGTSASLVKIVYILIGVSAVYVLVTRWSK